MKTPLALSLAAALSLALAGCNQLAVAAAKTIGISVAQQIAGDVVARKIEPRAVEFARENVIPTLAVAIVKYCANTPLAARNAARAEINRDRENIIAVECPLDSAPSIATAKAVDWSKLFTDAIKNQLQAAAPELILSATASPRAIVQNVVDRYCAATSFAARGALRGELAVALPPAHAFRIDCRGGAGFALFQAF